MFKTRLVDLEISPTCIGQYPCFVDAFTCSIIFVWSSRYFVKNVCVPLTQQINLKCLITRGNVSQGGAKSGHSHCFRETALLGQMSLCFIWLETGSSGFVSTVVWGSLNLCHCITCSMHLTCLPSKIQCWPHSDSQRRCLEGIKCARGTQQNVTLPDLASRGHYRLTEGIWWTWPLDIATLNPKTWYDRSQNGSNSYIIAYWSQTIILNSGHCVKTCTLTLHTVCSKWLHVYRDNRGKIG